MPVGCARAMWRLTVLAVCLAGCQTAAPRGGLADTIFYNAEVVAMTAPAHVHEAIALRDGRILAVGDRAAVMQRSHPGTVLRDLKGAAVLPGFIQAHAHFSHLSIGRTLIDLRPPPIGPGGSMDDIVSAFARARAANPDQTVLVGRGYDDTLLAEKRHPTRHDLDRAAKDVAIFALHVSGHLAAANSAGLALLGITADTSNPDGGVIQREADGRTPNGVLEESARNAILAHVPQPSPESLLALFEATAQELAALGITTATEQAALPGDIAKLRTFAASGRLPFDLIAYRIAGPAADGVMEPSLTYQDRFRVGGIKLFADGSIQGWTGFLGAPYFTQAPGAAADYRGYAATAPAELNDQVRTAFARGWPVVVHANGDAAIDMVIAAVRLVRQDHPQADIRPVINHAQMLRPDQIVEARDLGMTASFFVDHVYYWGDRHREIFLGPERAARISPVGAAARLGLPYTLHDDAPVVAPSPLHSVWAAVNRVTRAGEVLGPDERVTPYQALRGVTANAARQYFEEAQKGTLEPGKLADLVILDRNPLTAPPMDLKGLKVLETWKEGLPIYRRPD